MQMTLYHGSAYMIEQPEFGKGKLHNDYGRGFYCTERKQLACEWAVDSDRNGYCNQYALDLDGLQVLRLNSGDYTVLHWITLLLENRTFDVQSDFAQEALGYLEQNYSLGKVKADVIIGYRADDSYFSYALDFLNNTISVQTLAKAMRLGDLGEQVVLVSPKAFSQLHYSGAEEVSAAEYYGAKSERDRRARGNYHDLKKEPWRKGNLYMMEILDQEVKPDDDRIRL